MYPFICTRRSKDRSPRGGPRLRERYSSNETCQTVGVDPVGCTVPTIGTLRMRV